MADIFQDFPIQAPPERVFQAVSTPGGLDRWWTKQAAGEAVEGAEYVLWFGPEYDWRAVVTRCVPNAEFELQLTRADGDWTGTKVGFQLEPREAGGTWIRFHHTGWPAANEHYRISNHCWAMYLRILRRNLEHGETVPYEERLEV
jgi:uncharacterized protein YndB with AHSA1/START domain